MIETEPLVTQCQQDGHRWGGVERDLGPNYVGCTHCFQPAPEPTVDHTAPIAHVLDVLVFHDGCDPGDVGDMVDGIKDAVASLLAASTAEALQRTKENAARSARRLPADVFAQGTTGRSEFVRQVREGETDPMTLPPMVKVTD